MSLYWISEEYQARFTAKSEIQPGDPVYYYKTNSGWGGGETYKLFAVVERVTAKRVVIALWNDREQSKRLKTVRRASLSKRTIPFEPLD